MREAIYLKGDLKKHLWDVGSAGFISLIAMFILNAVDTYYVSRLGLDELTAMGFVFPLFDVVIGLSLGVGIAALSKSATALGANKIEEAKRFSGVALLFSFILGIFLAAVCYYFNDRIFLSLGAPLRLLPLIHAYMQVWYAGLPFLLSWMCSVFIFRAYGEPQYSSKLIVSSVLLNMVIAPFLIFGFLGLPHLGMMGSALANLIARAIILVILFRKMVYNDYVTFPLQNVKYYLRELNSIFFPAALTNLLPGLSMVFITMFLSSSVEAVAAYGITSKIQAVMMTPMFALSGGMSPLIAQNAGAKHIARARETYMLSCFFVLGMSIVSVIFLALCGRALASVFTSDVAVIDAAVWYFYIVPCSYVGWGFIMISASNFNALNCPKYSTVISTTRILILFLPLAFVLNKFLQYRGVFLAVAISNFLAGILGFMWVLQYYRKLEEIEHSAEKLKIL